MCLFWSCRTVRVKYQCLEGQSFSSLVRVASHWHWRSVRSHVWSIELPSSEPSLSGLYKFYDVGTRLWSSTLAWVVLMWCMQWIWVFLSVTWYSYTFLLCTLSCMRLFVPNKVIRSGKCFITKTTFKWILSCVYVHVSSEAFWVSKCFVAHITFERFLSCMYT